MDLINPSFNNVCYAGVAVGSGSQVLVAFVNVGSYYLVGIPLGVLFGFKLKLGTMVRSADERWECIILYIDNHVCWSYCIYLFFLKNIIAGDMDGHVDRDFTPNSHTSFHYRQNEVGDTGTVYFCSYIQLCSRYFHKNLRIAVWKYCSRSLLLKGLQSGKQRTMTGNWWHLYSDVNCTDISIFGFEQVWKAFINLYLIPDIQYS